MARRSTAWASWCCTRWTLTGLLLVGQLLLDVLRLAAKRGAPWRDHLGPSLPDGRDGPADHGAGGFLIGVVLAYLMSLQLRQFGAEPSSSTSWASR